MTMTFDTRRPGLPDWQCPQVSAAMARMLGEAPARIELDRTHFPAKRPLQLVFTATMREDRTCLVFGEYVPFDAKTYADQCRLSLGKTRNGQKPGLRNNAICVSEDTALVLRLPGLDERLPGLRLLYDPDYARSSLGAVLGCDPGPVITELVAHRLGKRAVLRLSSADAAVYVRLRAIKSGEGTDKLRRHMDLWTGLTAQSGLRIPKPLGALPEIGAAFFAALPGRMPDFGAQDSAAIAHALATLRDMELPGLQVHTGRDEARILSDWLDRCRRWHPELAWRITSGVARTCAALDTAEMRAQPCHRDLHEKQILIHDGVAGMLDFDTLCLSDPALDAGNLLAHLFFAGIDEAPLRETLDGPDLGLWRKAALFRLVMIYAFTSLPDHRLDRLIKEAMRHAWN